MAPRLLTSNPAAWENGYIESFNARLRDELLNGEIFYTLREAQIVIESWRRHYNALRPHASLGYKPPAPEVFVPAFAAGPASLNVAARSDEDGRPTRLSETVGFLRGTRSVEVVNPEGTVIGKIPVSAHSPKITGVRISTGTHKALSGPVTVSWSASDRDGEPLIASLLWSNDGGKSFEPIASQIQATSYTFDATKLRGTKGRPSGVLRVFVRDPVLSATSDVKQLIALGSSPHVRIAAPFAGQAFVLGQNVTLQANATDPEDGPIDRAITWSSDRDGLFGTGPLLSVRLSAGSHVLTARTMIPKATRHQSRRLFRCSARGRITRGDAYRAGADGTSLRQSGQ